MNLYKLLCAEAQLLAFLEYHEAKKVKDGGNGKRGNDKRTLLKVATNAYKAGEMECFDVANITGEQWKNKHHHYFIDISERDRDELQPLLMELQQYHCQAFVVVRFTTVASPDESQPTG
jgi:hypothetical protein